MDTRLTKNRSYHTIEERGVVTKEGSKARTASPVWELQDSKRRGWGLEGCVRVCQMETTAAVVLSLAFGPGPGEFPAHQEFLDPGCS